MASIGEEIKQRNFSSEYSKLVINVLFTAGWLNNVHSKLFKKHRLTPQQYNTLRILRGRHPECASVNVIKERMIDKMSNVSRILDKLVDKQLVTRKVCAEDRRQLDVNITEKGLQLLTKIDTEIVPLEAALQTISAEDAKTLNELLDRWRG